MMSMTSDVIDIDELNTGKRREGIFGAIYWWMVKFGAAIAGGLSGLILTWVGFKEGVPTTQQEGAISMLHILFSVIPIAGTLIAIWVMWDYDVSEEKAREISAELARRKTPKPSGYGANNVLDGMNLAGLSRAQLQQKFPQYYFPKYDYSNVEGVKSEFSTVFKAGMSGICFSVFTEKQFPGDFITEEQIRKRLEVLKPHTQWIRVFSSTHGHENIPKIAKEMGFKVLMGAWIGKDETENQQEIQSLIQLIKEGNVDIAAVGNEVLFRGDQNEETLLGYIGQVKNQTLNVPVTYIDVYYEIINHPKLVAESDKILINCYPFWEGASIENAGMYLQEMYHQTQKIAGGKEIIIAETGWPSKGEEVQSAKPSPENLMRYYIEAQKWASKEQINLFYFSSFDESWKIHYEGWAGTSWGLWDANEKFKF